MEQPVLTDCTYTHVIGSYCYTCVTGRVGYIRVTDLVQCNKYLKMLLTHGHFAPSKMKCIKYL